MGVPELSSRMSVAPARSVGHSYAPPNIVGKRIGAPMDYHARVTLEAGRAPAVPFCRADRRRDSSSDHRKMGGEAQGHPNHVYYKLAAIEYGVSGNPACNSSTKNNIGSTYSTIRLFSERYLPTWRPQSSLVATHGRRMRDDVVIAIVTE